MISEGIDSELTVLDVENFPIQRRWYVAYLGSKQLSVITKAFLDYLLEESTNFSVPSIKKLAKV